MQLTIDLPEQTFQRLAVIAQLTNQSLEDLIVQSITGNLPPAVETAPSEIQAELLELQTLSVETLRQIARSQVSPLQQDRHMALLERNQDGLLTPQEQQELRQLTLAADQLMLKRLAVN
ncbi:MAG: hypothetical protein KME30_06610 [Iphinoe sp. HA4291-MV1]|jgi:hypothetical protein|nr:hypothetical protein [Iphinoe sp. HA4291-MV1]